MKIPSRLAAGLVASAMALVACGGGGGGVSPEVYVKGLCDSVQTYLAEVEQLTTDFTSSLDPTATLDGQRDSVVAYLDDVIGATDTLIASAGDAGIPDVGDGESLAAAITGSFEQAKTVLSDAKAQVEALATDDPAAFAEELSGIGGTIQTSFGEIGTSLSSLESSELSAAVQGEPACASLAQAAGG